MTVKLTQQHIPMPNLANLKNHIPSVIGDDTVHRSAVCIPLLETEDGFDVLFETRSSDLPDQPGDVCFPGGMAEGKETPAETAVRETCEELLIERGRIEILGACDIYRHPGLIIFPFAVKIKNYTGTFSKEECAGVFQVPLSFFTETRPESYPVKSIPQPGEDFPYHLVNGGRDYPWRRRVTEELFWQYDGHVIWGITARILDAFLKIL